MLGSLVNRRANSSSVILSNSSRPKIWIPVVQPGYDDRLIPGREGLFQERDNGDFYRSTFEAALVSKPGWIFITSWNEWWEHSHIEPSNLYDHQYLQITKEFSDTWKAE